MNSTVRDWVSFWDRPHPIYVNARHLGVHYQKLADDMLALLPARGARILDYGCGEALQAQRVAEVAWELQLCEAAPKLRARLRQRFARNQKIKVLAPEEIDKLLPASLDLVIANSVVQYLSREELARLLALFRRRLRMGGQIIIADVIAPNQSALADASSLVAFAARHGFLFAAIGGLVRTAFSPYRALRERLGLTLYTEEEMLELLRASGFNAERTRPNLGHNQSRMAFRGIKAG